MYRAIASNHTITMKNQRSRKQRQEIIWDATSGLTSRSKWRLQGFVLSLRHHPLQKRTSRSSFVLIYSRAYLCPSKASISDHRPGHPAVIALLVAFTSKTQTTTRCQSGRVRRIGRGTNSALSTENFWVQAVWRSRIRDQLWNLSHRPRRIKYLSAKAWQSINSM